MQHDDQHWIRHVAAGGRLTEADEPSPGYRSELMRLLATFVDSELAGAAGLADFINRAPGLDERIALARIVSEKLGHAGATLALLERFGIRPDLYVQSYAWGARLERNLDLGTRRIGADRRLNVFHYPLQNWEDVTGQSLLMGLASVHQIGDLADCSYQPFAELVGGIVRREADHARAGERALAAAIERHGNPRLAQAAVDYWYPRVAASFGRAQSEGLQRHRLFGLRRTANPDLQARWRGDAADRLAALGLSEPAPGA